MCGAGCAFLIRRRRRARGLQARELGKRAGDIAMHGLELDAGNDGGGSLPGDLLDAVDVPVAESRFGAAGAKPPPRAAAAGAWVSAGARSTFRPPARWRWGDRARERLSAASVG
jgi:hypothetical protein